MLRLLLSLPFLYPLLHQHLLLLLLYRILLLLLHEPAPLLPLPAPVCCCFASGYRQEAERQNPPERLPLGRLLLLP